MVFGQIRNALGASGLTLAAFNQDRDDSASGLARGRAGPVLSPFDKLCAELLASADEPASMMGVGSALVSLSLRWIEEGVAVPTPGLMQVGNRARVTCKSVILCYILSLVTCR